MIAVTGVNGLLGSALVERMQGSTFTGIDADEQRNAYLGDYRYLRLDLTKDAERALDELKPTVVIHGAAMTHVDRCETEAELAWAVNVDVTRTIAAWCRRAGARLVYVSTDYVFDGVSGGYDEQSPMRPLGNYAMTKAAGEMAVRTLVPNHVIARTSVPYGPFPHVKKDFVRWLRDELSAGNQARIVTDQVSNPTWVIDLARMVHTLALSDFRGIVHTTGATALSRFEFAQLIARVFDLNSGLLTPIVTADLHQASPRPLNASLRLLQAEALGLAPLTCEAGLRALKIYRETRSGV